ncbi:MAG TPA: transporter [Thermoanaerobaculia bacterium]
MRRWVFALALAGIVVAAPLAAQDLGPIVSDRPDFTESTGTIRPGHVQLEGGYTFQKIEDEESHSFGEILARIGIGERMEARLGVGSYTWIDGPGGEIEGYEDPSIGIKVRFTEGPGDLAPGMPAVSLILATTVPAGSEELTADEWQPEAKLALGWEVNSWLGINSNLNYGYPVEGDERFHQLSASLSASFGVTDRMGAFLEVFGFSEETPDGDSTRYLDGGVTYSVTDDLQLDARFGVGFNDSDPEHFAGIGAVVRW